MLKVEMDEHTGYEKYQHSDGTKKKNIRFTYGEFEVEVPQDGNSSFEPQIIKKREKNISEINQKINMYACGLTTRQIAEQMEEIYSFECSESFISNVTDKVIDKIQDW